MVTMVGKNKNKVTTVPAAAAAPAAAVEPTRRSARGAAAAASPAAAMVAAVAEAEVELSAIKEKIMMKAFEAIASVPNQILKV